MSTPPIILLGMHRSGTTLVTGLLEELGVFVGLRGGTNREAKLFKHTNKWIFSQLGATWDRPDNAAFASAPEFRSHVDRVIRGQVKGARTIGYLGPARALRTRDLRRLDFPWAWKDPRNAFTVGLWKRVFPDAKIVHVYRHPLDVASSLKRREEARLQRFAPSLRSRLSEKLLVRDQAYCHSFRLLEPLEGVALWEQYVEASFTRCAPFEKDTAHCRYETLLARPEETLRELADFLGLRTTPDTLSRAVAKVNPERAYAHHGDAAIAGLASEISDIPLVEKLDYHGESGRRALSSARGL